MPPTGSSQQSAGSTARQALTTAGGSISSKLGFATGFDLYAEDPEGFSTSFGRLEDWLRRAARQPFFLFVHTYDVHAPYDPPPPFDTRFGPEGPISKPLRGESDWMTAVNRGERTLSDEERAHLVRLYDGNLALSLIHI